MLRTPFPLFLFGLLLLTTPVRAQPSDAQIKKDLMNPGVLSITLHGRGAKVWSSTYMQYFWDRYATIVRNAKIAEYPNAKIEIYGVASYARVGGGYRFQRFGVTENTYTGIPAPSQSEVLQLVNADLPTLLGYHYEKIVGDFAPVKFPAKTKWNWHTPNSISFPLVATFTEPINTTQTEKKTVTFDVRIYRDAIKGKWNRFISSEKNVVSLGKTTYDDPDDIKAMPTLADKAAERAASARLNTLPDVEIPAFQTDLEVFAYLHNAMRDNNAAKFEAILRRMLGGYYRAANSEVALNNLGEELVKNSIKTLFKGKSNYAEQYGPDLNIKHYQPNMLEFWNADGRHFSRLQLQPEGGQWKDGVKVNQKYAIIAFEVWVIAEKDEIERLRSMSPEKRFAPMPGVDRFSQISRASAGDGGLPGAPLNPSLSAAAPQALVWKAHEAPDARLKINFPGEPKATKGESADGYPMWTLEATQGAATAKTISVLLPTRPHRGQAQSLVNAAIEAEAKARNATIKRASDYMEGTYGKVFTLESGDATIKGRAIVMEDVLYLLLLSSDAKGWQTLNERDFIGSFEAR